MARKEKEKKKNRLWNRTLGLKSLAKQNGNEFLNPPLNQFSKSFKTTFFPHRMESTHIHRGGGRRDKLIIISGGFIINRGRRRGSCEWKKRHVFNFRDTHFNTCRKPLFLSLPTIIKLCVCKTIIISGTHFILSVSCRRMQDKNENVLLLPHFLLSASRG